ncbi:MAG TPA: PEPxxWA-CTERM sorting domain-containing protein [Caulobacteraceae bacterium]|jgi:hypothetical protein
MSKSYRIGLAGALALGAAAAPANAAVLSTIDLTTLEGTSWSSIASAPVRLSFGSMGMGSVSVAAVNGGAFVNDSTPASGGSSYDAVLGSGDTLHSLANGTGIFSISSPNADAPGGFTLTFTLDSGDFLAGTAFIIGSLDRNAATPLQDFSPGTGFGAMDTASLPSDGAAPMAALGPGGLGALYGSSIGENVSDTRAFQLTGAQHSLTIEMLQSPDGSGGIRFAVALPDAVPEPATWGLLVAGFGMVGAALRRRERTVTAV